MPWPDAGGLRSPRNAKPIACVEEGDTGTREFLAPKLLEEQNVKFAKKKK